MQVLVKDQVTRLPCLARLLTPFLCQAEDDIVTKIM